MKFTNCKLYLLSCLVYFFAHVPLAHSQNNNNNIYTRFGLGSLEMQANPQQFGMGGTGVASNGQHGVNFLNPAALSYIPLTTLQASGGGMSVKYKYNDTEANYGNGYLKNVAFGFRKPGSKWGFALGMQPYSFVNYEASSDVVVSDTLNTTYTYSGNGGMTKATLGFGRKFFFGGDSTARKEKRVVSFGLNTHYLFGTIDHASKIGFPDQDNYNYGKFSQNHFLNGFQLEAGVLFTLPISHVKDANNKVVRRSDVQIGITYAVQSSLHAKSVYIDEILAANSTIDYPIDTTFMNESVRFNYDLPQQITAGLAWNIYNQKLGNLQLNLEFMTQDWSSSKLNLGSDATSSNQLSASNRLSAGIAYTPENSANTSTLRHCTYRAGYYQGQTYWKIDGQQVHEQAITAGVSIPILKSLNAINLGAAYYTLGESNSGLLEMSGVVYQVGFTFVPREPWFFQRKYD